MGCYHPSKVNVSRKSSVGSRRVPDAVVVPCGHCLGCRSDQARGWAVRLVHEGVINSPAWFVTLTYAPEKLPLYGSLVPRHLTLFLKRLREAEGTSRISYYAAGEYGEKTSRAHYHAVLFGPLFLDRVVHGHRHNAPVYRSESLEFAWRGGLCELTGLTYGAARYVASYVRKKVRARDFPEHYTRVDSETGELVELQREFGRMSRRPAIGRRWIERYWRDVYPRDYVTMDGRELKPPRYYDKYMDLEDVDGGSRERRRIMMEVRLKRYAEAKEVSQDQLLVREKAHEGRISLFEGRSAV